MAEVLEGFEEQMLRAAPPVTPTEVDDAAIRRQLRDQVARLESELGALFCSTYPRTGFEWNVRARGGPRLPALSEPPEPRDPRRPRVPHHPPTLPAPTSPPGFNTTAACSPTARTWRTSTAAASRRCCSSQSGTSTCACAPRTSASAVASSGTCCPGSGRSAS